MAARLGWLCDSSRIGTGAAQRGLVSARCCPIPRALGGTRRERRRLLLWPAALKLISLVLRLRQQQRFLVGLFQGELSFECSQELLLVRYCFAQSIHSRLPPLPPVRMRHRPPVSAHARGKLRVYMGANDSPLGCTHMGRDGWRGMQARACALVSQCSLPVHVRWLCGTYSSSGNGCDAVPDAHRIA